MKNIFLMRNRRAPFEDWENLFHEESMMSSIRMNRNRTKHFGLLNNVIIMLKCGLLGISFREVINARRRRMTILIKLPMASTLRNYRFEIPLPRNNGIISWMRMIIETAPILLSHMIIHLETTIS